MAILWNAADPPFVASESAVYFAAPGLAGLVLGMTRYIHSRNKNAQEGAPQHSVYNGADCLGIQNNRTSFSQWPLQRERCFSTWPLGCACHVAGATARKTNDCFKFLDSRSHCKRIAGDLCVSIGSKYRVSPINPDYFERHLVPKPL